MDRAYGRGDRRISYTDEPLYDYHQHETNVVGQVFKPYIGVSRSIGVLLKGARNKRALLEAARAGWAVNEYSALEVKSSVVGYGRAEKQQVQQMVKALLNLPAPPESEDAADALALAICHAHHSHAKAQMAGATR